MSSRETLKVVSTWVAGIPISLAVANLFALLFMDSTEAVVWDSAVQYSVRQEGQVHRHRTEGWADTRIGRHGVNGIADIRELRGPKIVFWGDSHVEGYPLADEDKLAQQFNRLPGAERPTAFAVGLSGSTVTTAYHLLPYYEELAPPVRHHFIVITRLQHILPDETTREPYALVTRPVADLRAQPPIRPEPWKQEVIRWLKKTRLPLPYRLYAQAAKIDPRFGLGMQGRRRGPAEPSDHPAPIDAWAVLLDRLQQRTEVPIAFVYCPRVPYLQDGRMSFEDPHHDLIEVFAAQCRRRGIPFLSLYEEFSELYRTTGQFPRGFVNNHPYLGHLNPRGTRLVAEKVADFLAGDFLAGG